MSAARRPRLPTWIEPLPRRPLCDVPWFGRSVVLSTGAVNFCCYSDAVVGNVNEQPLERIWHGEAMTRIRDELAHQRFPKECQSNSCPIFRGDERTHLIERMEGPLHGLGKRADVARSRMRAHLARSTLRLSPVDAKPGETLCADLVLRWSGRMRLAVDVVVGATFTDGRIRFLPDLADFPRPCRRDLWLKANEPVRIALVNRPIDGSIPPGEYELCVGLCLADRNPNVAGNICWSCRKRFRVH